MFEELDDLMPNLPKDDLFHGKTTKEIVELLCEILANEALSSNKLIKMVGFLDSKKGQTPMQLINVHDGAIEKACLSKESELANYFKNISKSKDFLDTIKEEDTPTIIANKIIECVKMQFSKCE